MNKRTRVLVINSFGGGGAERQFSILANTLHFDRIICLENENTFIDVNKHPITFLTNQSSATSSLLKYVFVPIYALKLFRALKHIENPLVLTVLERSHLAVFLLSFFKKLDYIMCFQVSHESHYKNFSGKILKFIFKYCCLRSKKMISNSAVGAQEIITHYHVSENKVSFIPNGYDFNEINTRGMFTHETPHPELLSQNYILCVARFFEQKAQDKLIIAFSTVKNTKPSNLKLVFAGLGDRLTYCIQLSKSLHLKTFVVGENEYNNDFDVYFLNFQKNPLVLMKHATLFAFPTYYEGLPNALIEAMICGAVPIVSDCPTGPREILTQEANGGVATENTLTKVGILTPPFHSSKGENKRDIEHWAKAIHLLMEDAALLESCRRNLPDSVARFNITLIQKEWENLISKL